MRILFYSPFKHIDNPIPSGDREIARGLVDFFQESGHEVKILSRFETEYFWFSPRRIFNWPFSLLRAIWVSIFFKPDLFFTYHNYFRAPDALGPFVSWIFAKPLYYFEGMYGIRARGSVKTWLGWFLVYLGFKQASHVFTDKKIDIEGLEQILKKEQITYLPPAINTKKFTQDISTRQQVREQLLQITGQKNDSTPIIIGVAMLREQRKGPGVNFLLDCLAELKAEGLDFIYIHVGDGEMFEVLQKKAQMILGNCVQFVGRKNTDEIVSLLSASDIFAFPGIDEAFGMVYLEAQSCGLPVIAFDNGGIPEAVSNNETGFLTQPFNKESMTGAIRKLLIDQNLRKTMSINAKNRVQMQFDRRQAYQLILNVICQG